jgi:TonB-dependent receptor
MVSRHRLRRYSRLFSFIVPFLFVFASFANAATIKGVVTDVKSQEPLAGVKVSLVGSGLGAVTGLDGSYTIKRVPTGTYTIKAVYSSYETITLPLTIDADDQVFKQNFGMTEHTVHGSETVITADAENGSDISAQQKIANSDNVINAVSARSIQISPDLSVAEVSQRVSGVTLTRNSTGDAQYAIIRGMDQRYNYTTINGIKIPSPDNKDNYVPLDIFPSDLVDRLEVYKTLLPSMEGDAVGGVMNLVMKEAPDRLLISANAATGYDGLFFNQKFTSFTFTGESTDPRIASGNTYHATTGDFPVSIWNYKNVQPGPNQYYGITLGDRFLEDRNLGVLISASYQNSYRGTNTQFFITDINQNRGLAANTPLLADAVDRTYSQVQTRAGVEANVDYRLDDNNKFTLFGTYVSLAQNEQRDNIDTNLQLQWQGQGTAGQIIWDRRSEVQDESIGNITLSGYHTIWGKNLEAHWDLVYSKAGLNMPDQAVLDLATSAARDTNGKQLPEKVVVDLGSSRVWENNADEHKSAHVTFKTSEDILGAPTEFMYGGMYRATNRTSTFDEYDLRPGSNPAQSTTQLYNGNIAQDTFSVFNPGGSSQNALDYTAHENITAGFLQAKFQIGNLQTIGGVRIENTDFGWADNLPVTDTGVTGSVGYIDILPSISFKYSPTDNQNYRLSYFHSVNRPTFYEVIPFETGQSLGDNYKQRGNPFLQRATADNIDMRWEYFPGGLDQLIVGLFYKNIQNPIEQALEKEVTTFYLVPENFGTATNYGFELDAVKYLANFGVKLNYTYTKSAITTSKSTLSFDSVGTHVRFVQQARPLQGQADHVGNLSFLYRDFENGTDAQIGLVYTGQHIVAVSPFLNNDIWQDGYTQIDFSAEQRISGGLTLYLKINNLLNQPVEQSIHQPYVQSNYTHPIYDQVEGQNVLVRKDQFDRTYILGLRFKF